MKNKEFKLDLAKIEPISLIVKSDIEEKYGNDKNKLEHAKAAQYYLEEYFRNLPIGMNWGDKRDIKKELKTYIHGRFDGSIPPPNDSKQFFLLEFLVFSVLSGLISWLVRRFMDKMFPENE